MSRSKRCKKSSRKTVTTAICRRTQITFVGSPGICARKAARRPETAWSPRNDADAVADTRYRDRTCGRAMLALPAGSMHVESLQVERWQGNSNYCSYERGYEVIQERHEPDDERGHATIAGAVPY